MTERLQPHGSNHRTARRRAPRSRTAGAGTLPVPPPRYRAAAAEPTILGFPAEVPGDDELSVGHAGPDVSPPELAVVKRADPFGAGALVLAGVAANVSLLLSWSPGEGPTGVSLVKRGVEALGAGVGDAPPVVWQPIVVVVSGGILILLGLLLLVPARAHRLVGVLALVVSLAGAAAVVLLIADSGLADDRFGPGMWCAVAVPVLGVLGALKAMLTVPLVTLAPLGSAPSSEDAGAEL
ncbi:hypothetical protein [Blastococcus sp. CT_GayMR16]|uniref:hypothetical protein n=1 Tax=Blastococcus sp. CT_GayMR16 TaxID=2559607 RepID=UPI001072EF91|nr:hypothetical protein [Blastococcus sp. CT_GayMR16]TFV86136.1 hypothetical protein E4P38_17930 [Blastococcus sp. CT_GayMR16]